MSKLKRKSRKGRTRRARPVTISAPKGFKGDHGTGTQAATHGTVLVAVKDSPNNMGRRQRVNVIDTLTSLTMRQVQAAKEIQNAYGMVESLSSGGPLKEQVQSSPKPDAVVAAQVDAQTRLARAMKAVHRSERAIVEHICWNNRMPLTLDRTHRRRWLARFAVSLDRVADHLRY